MRSRRIAAVLLTKDSGAERLKFFADAVVAIALTLLILPLMDAVSEASAKNLDTAELLNEHGNQVVNFSSASRSLRCSGPCTTVSMSTFITTTGDCSG